MLLKRNKNKALKEYKETRCANNTFILMFVSQNHLEDSTLNTKHVSVQSEVTGR